ncbi:MAG TPA: hypothetical protein VIY86_06185 [Pirellulaceae bacterium]
MLIVKRGDRYDTTWTVRDDWGVPVDLNGTDVRLIARTSHGEPILLPFTIPNPSSGEVIHRLDGTLRVATYRVEAELTRGTEIKTAPTITYANLRVISDLG